MIKININEVLYNQKRSIRWLSNEIKCDYSNLWNLCNGNPKLIRLEMLEKICKTLDCEVSDIIVIYDSEGEE